jgi:hypothetical protein
MAFDGGWGWKDRKYVLTGNNGSGTLEITLTAKQSYDGFMVCDAPFCSNASPCVPPHPSPVPCLSPVAIPSASFGMRLIAAPVACFMPRAVSPPFESSSLAQGLITHLLRLSSLACACSVLSPDCMVSSGCADCALWVVPSPRDGKATQTERSRPFLRQRDGLRPLSDAARGAWGAGAGGGRQGRERQDSQARRWA